MKLFQPSPGFRSGRPWRVEMPWIFMPLTLLVTIGVVIMAAIFVSRHLRHLPSLLAEGMIQSSMVLTVLLMFALVPPWGRIADKLGIRKIRWGDLGIVLVGLLLIYAWQIFTMPLWTKLLERLNFHGPQQQSLLTECSQSSPLKYAGMLALAAVLIPFVEEVVYRRLLFGVLRPLGVWAALLLTASIFAAMHGFIYGFPALFGLGAVFQWQYLRSGNLWTSTLTHMIYNAISLTLVFFLR